MIPCATPPSTRACPQDQKENTSYDLENAGKTCVCLNTKTEAGRAALEKLIAEADIFITNWRQTPLKKAALDYDTLHAKYPKLVYGFVSGYGEKGPDKDLPASTSRRSSPAAACWVPCSTRTPCPC